MINSITIVSIFHQYIDRIQKQNIFFLYEHFKESRYTAYNATHLSGIVHQKGWLNFCNMLVSDRKHIFLNKNLTTQNRHVELSKTVLTSKIRLHVPTQHTGMFVYTLFSINFVHVSRILGYNEYHEINRTSVSYFFEL